MGDSHHHRHDHKGHHHAHSHRHHGHHEHGAASGNLLLALILNLFFASVEIVGGMWCGSVAVQANAIHDLGDALALGFAYVFERLAKRAPTSRFSYGFRRLSLLSALVTSTFLVVGSTLVLAQAIPRLTNPSRPDLNGMLAFALLGIVVNGFAALRLLRGRTMNERVATWHFLEDLFGWLSVGASALVMRIVDLPILDPIMSILLSLFIALGVARNLRVTLGLFLQATPHDVDLPGLKRDIAAIPGIHGIHDTHLWSLDGEQHVLTLHAVVDAGATVAQVDALRGRIRALAHSHGRIHVTVETEAAGDACVTRCD